MSDNKQPVSLPHSLWYWLWEAKWDFSDPRFEKLAWWVASGTAIGVPIGLVSQLHVLDFLGPALGDDTGYHYVSMLVNDLQAAGHTSTLVAFVGAIIAFLLFRGYFIYLAFNDYAKNNEQYPNDLPESKRLNADGSYRKFPIDIFFLFVFFNASMLIGISFIFILLGISSWLFGFGFMEGYELAKTIVHFAEQLANTHVPTLIDLPPIIAIPVLFTVTGFFHYWLHRLAHEYRALWLLLHRPHHMPSTLMEPLLSGVVIAFPLGFLIMFPYILFFGACTKLFSSEPLFFEFIVFNIIVNIPNATAHSTALYHVGFKYKWIGFLGHLFGSAQHHYLHHASDIEYSRYQTNVTNVGGGLWMVWDKVFGTFMEPPVSRPNVGLTGNPKLYMNPVRLLLSGLVQIIYELKHNKDWGVRMQIIFGKSDYVPPISKDFVVQEPDSKAQAT
jgi:sterol desaturase/sphingolipid hydroxylase (fatty acid hydroxylase superfamily)